MKKSTMQIALTKVLASMSIADETKVLIALSLVTDSQIGLFFQWLKENITEDRLLPMEEEIAGRAIEISKGWDAIR